MDLVLLFHVIGTSKVMLEQDTDYLGQGKWISGFSSNTL